MFSPPLDTHGNSVRGIAFCEALSEHFELHLFSPPSADPSVVRRTYGGDAVRSKRQRMAFQDAELTHAGTTTRVVELQGLLRFGSCEVLSRAVAAELDGVEVIILDFRRVSMGDKCVGSLLGATAAMVDRAGVQLVLASAAPDVAPGIKALSFDALDDALEWREDQLLKRAGLDQGPERIPFADVEALQGVDASFLPKVEAAGRFCNFSEGELVFSEGDPADRMYILVAGRVDILLTMNGSLLRESTFGPGITFGDMAALYGGRRTASVRAAMPSVCFEMEVAALDELCRDRPDVLLEIHKNVARALAKRVRQLNNEVRALN